MFQADPYAIRPKRGWAIVRQDQRKSVLSSGIILADETIAEKLHEGAGIIIRLGPGPKNEALGIQPGDRVLYRTYLRHAIPIETSQKWLDGTKMEYFFIDTNDLVALISPDLQVGPLSERKAP